jgi:putative endonuclease
MGRRTENQTRGDYGEWLAGLWLMAKGYRILARQYKAPGGEIDLVALSPPWSARMVVFVEVRARGTVEAAISSVNAGKRERVMRTASQFCARRRELAKLPWRYDLILLAPRRWPTHIRDAWNPGWS